eukprot:364852-Chlamydomonas_euryale.AAC.10
MKRGGWITCHQRPPCYAIYRIGDCLTRGACAASDRPATPHVYVSIAPANTACCVALLAAQVSIEAVFGSGAHGVMSKLNVEGQHRGAVAAAKGAKTAAAHDHARHDHGHDHDHAEGSCKAHKAEHDHEHCHSHDHSQADRDHVHNEDCGNACEAGHDHSHAHGHSHGNAHAEEEKLHDGCKACEAGHDHNHDHTHHHSHGHKQEHSETTAAKRFGIYNFVYCRRRPFHPQRWVGGSSPQP